MSFAINIGKIIGIIIEHQEIINLLDNISNQPSKFRTKRGVYNKWSIKKSV